MAVPALEPTQTLYTAATVVTEFNAEVPIAILFPPVAISAPELLPIDIDPIPAAEEPLPIATDEIPVAKAPSFILFPLPIAIAY